MNLMRFLLIPMGAAVLAAAGSLCAAEAWRSEPLAPRSQAGGTTLFTRLAPERTGMTVANPYDDPAMWADRYQELVYGAIGTGVAVGDYDGDGRPDVFVATKTGQGRLYRNLGDWRFEDVTEKAGLAEAGGSGGWMRGLLGRGSGPVWTQGVTFVDVNNDGWLDLYVCRFAAPNRLYINQGDGTFREEAEARGLALSDASGMAAFADYDRDGWLDVYVQTNMLSASSSPEGQRDRLYRNRGDGTFEDVTDRAGIRGVTLGHAAIWWDADGDGWPDLYVANDYAGADHWYRNRRDGTFAEEVGRLVPRTPYYSMGADLGDVNNDGLIDFFVADMATTSHEKDQRGMAGSRTRAQEEPAARDTAPQRMRNALYLNTGLGRMREAADFAGLAATDWTWSVRLEDLDNDGRLDVHVTNGMAREYHNTDLLARIMSAEGTAESRQMMKASPVLAEANLAYRNRGDGRFEEVGASWGLDEVGVSFGAAFGDFDGDGDLDLIHANYEGPPTVLRNDAPGGRRLVVALRGTESNRFGVGAVVRIATAQGRQVRTLVLARGYLSQSEPVLHFGLGEAAKVDELTVEWPSGHVQRFTDLAVDQRVTITEPKGAATKTLPPKPPTAYTEQAAALGLALTAPEETTPERETQALVPFRFDRRGPSLAVADVNGDGRYDLALGGTRQSPLTMSTGQSLPPTGADDGPILFFDYDGDGGPDLLRTGLSVNPGAPSAPVLYRNDQGRFTATDALPKLAQSTGAAVAADFDRDGDLDLFLGARYLPGRYPRPGRSAWLRNDTGRFADATDTWGAGLSELGLVTSALATDLNDDGWIDLLVATEWGQVRALVNDQGRRFTDRTEALGFASAGTGWWTALASADFNQDGRPDYVAGNVGLNTPYRPPALLFEGDFRGGGAPILIEAHQEGDRLYPRRTKQELAALLPILNRRYPRNDDYAKATLPEIVGEGRLQAARRYEATELQSGVFLSQPDGTFRFVALPPEAQLAPFQGIVAGDFDGDGFADLYAVQNSFAPVPSIGRFDGGLSQLFLGDGKGGFTPVPPGESGLLVTGDAKALVTLDLNADGWPDFVVTRNDAPSQAYMRTPEAGRAFLRVRLQGPSANPTAVGARLRLTLADGRTQTAELTAGGGYASQGPAEAAFGYPLSAPPRSLEIRWPDGTTTTQRFAQPPPPVLTVERSRM